MTIDVTKPNSSETFAQIWADIRADLVEIVTHINDAATAHGLATVLVNMADYILHKANVTDAHDIDVTNSNIAALLAEMQAARGSMDELDDRLSVAVQNDGNIKLTSLASYWIDNGDVPTYISNLSFSVPGDRTKVYLAGVIMRATVATGYVYGIVATASYGGGITTVTFSAGYPVLTSPVSKIELALLAFDNTIIASVAQNSADILDLQSQMSGLSYLGTGGYGTLTWEDTVLSYDGDVLEI
jgi:hypothetical protein